MSYNEDLREATHRLCDKCNTPVPLTNDMTIVEAATGLPGAEWAPTLWYCRHFLPVIDDDGNVLCEGSPSRAQYIEGQPRDARGYPYFETMELVYRAAWARVQEHFARISSSARQDELDEGSARPAVTDAVDRAIAKDGARMQTPEQKSAVDALFKMTAAELGRAAVARKKDGEQDEPT